LKNEGSENEGLWVQTRCRSPSLQLHVLLTVNTEYATVSGIKHLFILVIA